jgi:Family of unknown function (DUF6644)
MSIFSLFQWLEYTRIGEALRTNRVLFPLVSIVHLLGLALLVGTILIIDLGLLGVGMQRQPVSRIARQLAPLTWAGLAVMLITGPILLTGEAIKMYSNIAFWIKLGFITLAVAFYFTTHRWATSDHVSLPPRVAKSVAMISLALWLCAGLAAKSINAVQ